MGGLADQDLSEEQMLSHWNNLQPAQEKKDKDTDMKKSSSQMDVDVDDKASACNSVAENQSTRGGIDGVSVAATPGTTVVGSTADSIAPSDLASDTGMMDVDEAEGKEATPKLEEKKVAEASSAAADEKKDVDMEGDKKEKETPGEEEKKEEPEPTEEILNNPCRVLSSQLQFICFPSEIEGVAARYVPLLGEKRKTGFLVLRDQKPEEPEDLFLEGEKREDDEDEKEPDPPEPFEWTDTQ